METAVYELLQLLIEYLLVYPLAFELLKGLLEQLLTISPISTTLGEFLDEPSGPEAVAEQTLTSVIESSSHQLRGLGSAAWTVSHNVLLEVCSRIQDFLANELRVPNAECLIDSSDEEQHHDPSITTDCPPAEASSSQLGRESHRDRTVVNEKGDSPLEGSSLRLLRSGRAYDISSVAASGVNAANKGQNNSCKARSPLKSKRRCQLQNWYGDNYRSQRYQEGVEEGQKYGRSSKFMQSIVSGGDVPRPASLSVMPKVARNEDRRRKTR